MSVYYDVKEYLEIREIAGGNDSMVDLARKHLAWLGWKMLGMISAWVRKIFLSCGEKELCFFRRIPSVRIFMTSSRALADDSGLKAGTAIKLSMDYHYRWTIPVTTVRKIGNRFILNYPFINVAVPFSICTEYAGTIAAIGIVVHGIKDIFCFFLVCLFQISGNDQMISYRYRNGIFLLYEPFSGEKCGRFSKVCLSGQQAD